MYKKMFCSFISTFLLCTAVNAEKGAENLNPTLQADVDHLKKLYEWRNYQVLYKINGYPYAKYGFESKAGTGAGYVLENDRRCYMTQVYMEKIFPDKNKDQIKILDVGCDLGYITNCLADRGFKTHGIDNSFKYGAKREDHIPDLNKIRESEYGPIPIARLVAKINGIKNATFSVDDFNMEYVEKMKPREYDCVVIFAVLHDIYRARGFEYTRNLLNGLLEKVPVVILEMTEKSKISGNESEGIKELMKILPENVEVFFKDLKNTFKVEKVEQNYMKLTRPVYILYSKHFFN